MNAIRLPVVLFLAVLASACANPGAAPAPADMARMDMGAPGPMAAMDPRMKTMQEMHQKMMNARTPEERQALMADHLKAMQGGMAMMKDMHGQQGSGGMAGMGDGQGMPDPMARHHRMMADHLATLQMMMDMMAERMPPASTDK